MESDINYKKVHITIQLSNEFNKLLSESAKRAKRRKIQEVVLRLEDHLKRFRSISELNQAVLHKQEEALDAPHGHITNP